MQYWRTARQKLENTVHFQSGSHAYNVSAIRLHDYDLDKTEQNELFLFLVDEIIGSSSGKKAVQTWKYKVGIVKFIDVRVWLTKKRELGIFSSFFFAVIGKCFGIVV